MDPKARTLVVPKIIAGEMTIHECGYEYTNDAWRGCHIFFFLSWIAHQYPKVYKILGIVQNSKNC